MPATFEDTNNRYSLLFDLVEGLSSDESSSALPTPSPSTSLFDLPRSLCVGRYSPKELAVPDIHPSENHSGESDACEEKVETLYSDNITLTFLKAIGACHCFNAETAEQVDNFLGSETDDNGKRHEKADENAEEDNEAAALAKSGSKDFESLCDFDEQDPPAPFVPCSTPLVSSFEDHISFHTPEKLHAPAYSDSDIEDADQVPHFVRPTSQITARMDFDTINTGSARALPRITQRIGFDNAPLPPLSRSKPRMKFGAEPESGDSWSDARCNDDEIDPGYGDSREPGSEESSADSEPFFTPFQTAFAPYIVAMNRKMSLTPQSPVTPSPRRVRFQAKPRIFSAIPSGVYDLKSPVNVSPSPSTSGRFPGTYSSPSTFVSPPRLTLKEKYRVKPSPRLRFDDGYDSDVENIIEEIERVTNSYEDCASVLGSGREKDAKVLIEGGGGGGGGGVSGGMVIMLVMLALGLMIF
ncbi:hypothetical protein BJ165DRAFT_1612761 [Panaeolus papilionaceus]|nr:hypothetical protein BJ165DRAFT_1612761 [Panaeolus papilionaceus]